MAAVPEGEERTFIPARECRDRDPGQQDDCPRDAAGPASPGATAPLCPGVPSFPTQPSPARGLSPTSAIPLLAILCRLTPEPHPPAAGKWGSLSTFSPFPETGSTWGGDRVWLVQSYAYSPGTDVHHHLGHPPPAKPLSGASPPTRKLIFRGLSHSPGSPC